MLARLVGERLTRFYAGGSTGFWWTRTEANEPGAYYRSMIYALSEVSSDTHPKRMGFPSDALKINNEKLTLIPIPASDRAAQHRLLILSAGLYAFIIQQ